jgi:hypothetical protein
MLQIGTRKYDLVSGQSGFVVWLERREHVNSLQQWRLDAHYVPSSDGPSHRADGIWEHLRLTIFPHDYQVANWRELDGLGLGPKDGSAPDPRAALVSIENLIAPLTAPELFHVVPGELKMRHTEGYHFACEFDGFVRRGDREEEVRFLDEIPFIQACLRVPINAADPVTNAHARVVRELGAFEIEDGRVTRHDWRRAKDPKATLADGHQVVLRTAWRNQTA